MKTWCKHIQWLGGVWDKERWRITALDADRGLPYKSVVIVPNHWRVCPICQCERPTRANLAAALNRELQDGEQ